jgi:hypothetical protein
LMTSKKITRRATHFYRGNKMELSGSNGARKGGEESAKHGGGVMIYIQVKVELT